MSHHLDLHPYVARGIQSKLSTWNKWEFDLHNNILYDVQCYTAYPLFYPKKNESFKKTIVLIKNVLWVAALIALTYFVVFYNW